VHPIVENVLLSPEPQRSPRKARLLLPSRLRSGSVASAPTSSWSAAVAGLARLSAEGDPNPEALLAMSRVALGGQRAELTLVDDHASRWTSRDESFTHDDRPLIPHDGELWRQLTSSPAALVLDAQDHPGVRASGAVQLLCSPLMLHGEVIGLLAIARDVRVLAARR
jgi:hypothetical protein